MFFYLPYLIIFKYVKLLSRRRTIAKSCVSSTLYIGGSAPKKGGSTTYEENCCVTRDVDGGWNSSGMVSDRDGR